MASAAAGHMPEERGGVAFAGEAGEFVDGGDDEGWREPVDLLVSGQDRQPVGDVAVAFGEGALTVGVGASHHDAFRHLGDVTHGDVVGGQTQAAPGAVAELEGGEAVTCSAAGVVAQALELLGGLAHAFGGHGGADPQADAEGFAAPGGGVLSAGELGGAHESGGALELLGGEQTQGVAHEDGDAGTPVDGPVRGLEEALPAANGEGIGGQPQVGFGFAATGGEEQELDGGEGSRAPLGRRIGEGGQLHEDESELENAPVVGVAALQDVGLGLFNAEVRAGGANGGDLGVDALVGHDLVHEGEAAACLRPVRGVGGEVCQALGELRPDLAGLGEGLLGRVPQMVGQVCGGCGLLIEPRAVGADDGFQGVAESIGAVRSGGRGNEGAHVEEGAVDIRRGSLGGLDGRDPGGADLDGPAGYFVPCGGGWQAPVGGAGAADGELEPVAVLEVQAGLLAAGFRPWPRARVRRERGVVDGKEDGAATGVDVDAGLEHPGLGGDAPGGGSVVAQGELDEVAASGLVEVGVDAEGDVPIEDAILGAARGEGGGCEVEAVFVGYALVAGACVGGGLAGCGLRPGGLVGAPADVDVEGVEVGGDLESQAHGGGDHESPADGLIIGVLARVLVHGGAEHVLLGAGDGDAGGGCGVQWVNAFPVLRGLGGWSFCGVLQAGGGDAPEEVALAGLGGEDLRVALGGAEEFAAQDLQEAGAGGDGGGGGLLLEDVGGAVVGRGLRHRGSPPDWVGYGASHGPSSPATMLPQRRRGGGSPPGAGPGSPHGWPGARSNGSSFGKCGSRG